ncbi:secreted endopolyphosphatase [Phycomyces blakesleeanus]|uniref:Secreted endopolyphosphatase n=2 Tax=Phycomyces blakesleeanus TaxID=4837 RepID=A0A162Q369_PHYB8|nr:secreted endopolyphosphatase [Phycomyces blakesleeanus NRRL 1555(-)]OAD79586.1 secreted endopolyphosphatase [Phycomyces blakesleeanus NRRL 1555(-)]|eukprot:XP_018297626.1 secreted endopolyphosphatase [Phycomyces blakesleeanus NRRL 1555(-)]
MINFYILPLISLLFIYAESLPLSANTHPSILESNRFNQRALAGTRGRFLHVTDIHLDTLYLAHSDPKQLCHRMSKKKKDNIAGIFGALGTKCDSPMTLVEASFDFIKKSLSDVDFVFYTGDTARHERDVLIPRSEKEILEEHTTVIKYFKDICDIHNIPFIPVVGNNDMVVHNDMPANDPIFGMLKTIWSPFNLNLGPSFDKGGYFVQDIIPGKLQAMVVNSMYFFNKNIQKEDCDVPNSPGEVHIAWMKQVLKNARTQHKMTYVLGHIPTNDDDGSIIFKPACHKMYIDVLGTYSDLIAGHFTGHTNSDALTAIVKKGSEYSAVAAFDKNNSTELTAKSSQIVSVLFNAPSIIPVHNPAMRVYMYDNAGIKNPIGTILDWTQYYADIKTANRKGKLEYKVEYQASHLFGVKTFNSAGFSKVFLKLESDKSIRKDYKNYMLVEP